jgi:hypothetical protein
MTPGALVVLAAGVHLAPLHVAGLLGQSQAAWEYVAQGLEAALLWLMLAAASRLAIVQAVAAWGAAEGGMRAGCRLAFPMDRAPPLQPGQNLCDAATGMPATLVSLGLAAAVVVVLDCTRRQ